MFEEEELQSQIEQLRAKRKEKLQEEEKPQPKKEDGILGVFTMQSIIAVIIAILYVIGLSFARPQVQSVVDQLKNKFENDFSFRNEVYDTVGEFITYLNTLAPVSQNGQGGPFISAENNQMPKNATFAPIIYTGSITYPLEKGKVTSGYGFRTSPIVKKAEFHNALDIAATENTPIRAAADGVVIKSDVNKSLGNYIVIDHSNGFTTTYGHCSRLIAKEGMRIREGEIIARVGSTGDSTGPHVHFAAKKDELYFDPNYLFNKTYWMQGED